MTESNTSKPPRMARERPRTAGLAVTAVLLVLGLVAVGCNGSDAAGDPTDATDQAVRDDNQQTAAAEPEVTEPQGVTTEAQAQQSDSEEGARPEFIELPYAETIDGSEMSFAFGDCTTPEPEIRLCEYELSDLILIEDDIGEARENRQGTWRITQEPCTAADGGEGTLIEDNAEGTIVAEDGDEFYFELAAEMCALREGGLAQLPATWTVTGGTGRFTDASGDMTFTPAPDGSGGSVGTLNVRADLWDTGRPSADGE